MNPLSHRGFHRFTKHARALVFWSLVGLIAAFLLIPTLIIVPMSLTTTATLEFPPVGLTLDWYARVLASPDWRDALANSLVVALAAATLATALGCAAALALHGRRFTGQTAVLGLLLSPMVTPVIVLAVALYLRFSAWGLIASHVGLVLAHTVLGIPFVLIAVLANARMVNPAWRAASLGLGASPWFTFRRVTLPLIAPGLASGWVFAFITSWDEVVVAMFLADASTRTVPIMIWNQIRSNINPSAAAVAVMLIAVSVLGVLLSNRYRQQQESRP